ncbi:IclR family transcriptional regulator [Sphingobium sp.]|uniref:IclR family transcriptional regulator n=1 Tax=Sphingobium sp. TaxID=1912891 RepID=UPI0028BE31F0|nr:helix-turn-helix domain-containing protein [Sphingobium sp.]
MARCQEAKSIKSARRVFEVLEYFDADHQEAGVMDIARKYQYPQSSASELLSYMVSLGYLRRGHGGRTYRLSIKAAMLGSWVQPRLIRQGGLLPLMDELAEATGGTVILAGQNGVALECLHIVSAANGGGLRQGNLISLLHSTEGRVLLARCDRQLVRRYVHRLNAETEDMAGRVRFEDLAAVLDQVAAQGFAKLVADDECALAVSLPQSQSSEPLALGLRVSGDVDEAALLRTVRGAISRRLGLVDLTAGQSGMRCSA